MGTDTVTILQNPIGQPMATVRFALLSPIHLTEPIVDHFQQSWNERYFGSLELDHHNYVCFLSLLGGLRAKTS